MRTVIPAVAFVAAATVLCAGCSVVSAAAPSSTGPTGSLGPSNRAVINPPSTSTPSGPRRIVLPTVTAITPSTSIGTLSGIPAPPPPPDTAASTYTSPVVVAEAWMQQFCATDYHEPINDNVRRAAVFATAASTAADLAAGDTPATYHQVVAQQLASRCADVTAQTDPDGPSSPTEVYVQVSAIRTQLAGGAPFQTMPVTSIRRVLRGADGRWLVDIAVDAG